jgi:hypothetical protein
MLAIISFIVISILLILYFIYLIYIRQKVFLKIPPKSTYELYYNPGYDKLFFSLVGRYQGEETSEIIELKNCYNKYDFFALPIVSNFSLQNKLLLTSDIRQRFEEKKIGLFILEINKYFDIHGAHPLEVHSSFSNTNYGYPTDDVEMSAAALSAIFDIELDGVDRLIFWSKGNDREFSFIPLEEFDEGFDFSRILNISRWTETRRCENILMSLTDYLSLRWEYSGSESNQKLKLSALKIREDLFKRFYLEGKLEGNNFFKLVMRRLPVVASEFNNEEKVGFKAKFQINSSSFESRMIAEKISTIKSEYKPKPNQSVLPSLNITLFKNSFESDLEIQVKDKSIQGEIQPNLDSGDVESIFLNILTLPGLEFKSKIFLKSAIRLEQIIDDEEIDFTQVTIGYSKFFESEINLSLVQLIRNEIGIPMPLYFNKYYDMPGDFLVKVREGYIVNFNVRDFSQGNYLPPGLGQSLNTSKRLRRELSEYIKELDELISEGKKLNEVRNKSAHPELVFKEDLMTVKAALIQIYSKGILSDLILAKERLKGTVNLMSRK